MAIILPVMLMMMMMMVVVVVVMMVRMMVIVLMVMNNNEDDNDDDINIIQYTSRYNMQKYDVTYFILYQLYNVISCKQFAIIRRPICRLLTATCRWSWLLPGLSLWAARIARHNWSCWRATGGLYVRSPVPLDACQKVLEITWINKRNHQLAVHLPRGSKWKRSSSSSAAALNLKCVQSAQPNLYYVKSCVQLNRFDMA